jgi:2-deoxy-D-gluconate 3-dehydrogenase
MVLDAFNLSGKNALVTGSQKGLGAAIAIALAEAGANVAVHGRSMDPQKTTESVRACGVKVVSLSGDLADPKFCEKVVKKTICDLGSIDILVNNAGIIRRAPAAEYSSKDWNDIIEVNLNSMFRLCQASARHMLKQRDGKIINIASVLSFQGGVFVPAYAAAKGGVVQLTRALANEWASHGINVNAIAPGYMATDTTAALRTDETRNRQIMERIPAGRWGKADDLAGAAVFLASSASNYVHGHVLMVDGGWMAR